MNRRAKKLDGGGRLLTAGVGAYRSAEGGGYSDPCGGVTGSLTRTEMVTEGTVQAGTHPGARTHTGTSSLSAERAQKKQNLNQ